MYQTFDEVAMDDLFYEAAEGPAATTQFDELDDGGQLFEEDAYDALEAVVADALGADEVDEFLAGIARGLAGLLRGGARAIPRVAQRARNVVGTAQRVAAQVQQRGHQIKPVLNLISGVAGQIPGPTGQAIGQVTQALSDSMPDFADDADEMDMLDALSDWLEDEGDAAIASVAPVMAGLALRRAMPTIARLPRPAQRQVVQSVSQAARTLVRQRGPQALPALVPIVRSAQQTVRQQRLPMRAMPTAIRQRTAQAARSPQRLQRLTQQARAIAPHPLLHPTRRAGVRRAGQVHRVGMGRGGVRRVGQVRSPRIGVTPTAQLSRRHRHRYHPSRRRSLSGGIGAHRPMTGLRRPGSAYSRGMRRARRIPPMAAGTATGLGVPIPGYRRSRRYARHRPGMGPGGLLTTAHPRRMQPLRPGAGGLATPAILSDRLPSAAPMRYRRRAGVCDRCGGVHRYRTCRPVYISVRGC